MTTYTDVFGSQLISPAYAAYNSFSLTANLALVWPQETAPNSNLATPLMDILPTTISSFSIAMPAANQVSVGTFLVINNLSSYTQTITDYNGDVIASHAAGSVFYYYITDNSTASGSWLAFQFGAAVSTPSVAAIAGSGLEAVGAQLAQDIPVTGISAPYTAVTADLAKFFNWTGGSAAFTLPLTATVGNAWFVQVRNSGASVLTITPSGSDLINGATTLAFNPGDSAIIVTDGTSWYTIGFGTTQPVFFNYQAVNVATAAVAGVITLGTSPGTNLNRIAYRFYGALTANTVVILPAYAQTYWINNATTGAYSLTFQVGSPAAGSTVTPSQSTQVILYADGANVINAVSGTGLSSPVLVSQGGTGVTTIAGGAALLALGVSSTGLGVAQAASAAAAQVAIAAASTADATVLSMVF